MPPGSRSPGSLGSSVPSAAAAIAAVAAAQQALYPSLYATGGGGELGKKLTIATTNGGHGHYVNSNSNSPNGSGSSRSGSGSGSGISPNHSFSNGYHHHPLKGGHSGGHNSGHQELRIPVDQLIPAHFLEQRIRTGSAPNSPSPVNSEEPLGGNHNGNTNINSNGGGSDQQSSYLQENEVEKVQESAVQIAKTLPPYVFNPQVPSKRKFSGDFEVTFKSIQNC